MQAIREALRECEVADGHTGIPGNAFDSEGEIDQADIACSACDDPECDDDNDILLCDGEGCNRAYHVTCLPVKVWNSKVRGFLMQDLYIDSTCVYLFSHKFKLVSWQQ